MKNFLPEKSSCFVMPFFAGGFLCSFFRKKVLHVIIINAVKKERRLL